MKRVPWWVIAAIVGVLGLGAWAPLVPGIRLRRTSWLLWGALWTVMSVLAWIFAGTDASTDGTVGVLAILAWIGSVATVLTIRPTYLELVDSGWTRARKQAEERLRERQEAVRLAAERPDLAVELGVGRPDRSGASAGGVVDVNNAPAAALRDLPGVDDALATRIVEVRAQIDGFASVEDLGGWLELDAPAVERLRPLVVFLPR